MARFLHTVCPSHLSQQEQSAGYFDLWWEFAYGKAESCETLSCQQDLLFTCFPI